jgi:hypothetical protein
MKKNTPMSLTEMIKTVAETQRLVVFAPDRHHAKFVERMCSEAKRNVCSNTWANFQHTLALWNAHRNCQEGIVMILTANPGTVMGWRTVADKVIWFGPVRDQMMLHQAMHRVTDGVHPELLLRDRYHCDLTVPALEKQGVRE